MGKFVLGEFSVAEQEELPALLDRCADAVETLVRQGLNRAQSGLRPSGSVG